MAVDLSIQNFAFDLFRKLWVNCVVPDVLSKVNHYPDATTSETEISEEILRPIYMILYISDFFEGVLDDDYAEFSTSRSDFHSYFTSSCRHFDIPCFPVMEKVLASAAFMTAIGSYCARKDHWMFVHSCPMSWAMYFDWELKNEFYDAGGWAELQNYSTRFQNASAFVLNFRGELKVCVQLLEYLKFYAPKLMETFDKKVSELWCFVTNTLIRNLSAVTNCKLQFDTNFKELVTLPLFLNVVCNSTDFDFLSYVRENKLSHCSNDGTYLQLDRLELYLQQASKVSCNLIRDSKSDQTNKDESRFFEYYRKHLGDGHLNQRAFPINDIAEVTEDNICFSTENLGARSKRKIPEETIKSEGNADSYHALSKQNESLNDAYLASKIPIKSESQNHPFASFENISSSDQQCMKTNQNERNDTFFSRSSNNPLFKNDTSNQSVCGNDTESKTSGKRRKKRKGKKRPLQESVTIKLKKPNKEADANAPASPGVSNSQDDLDIVLRNVLVLGVVLIPKALFRD